MKTPDAGQRFPRPSDKTDHQFQEPGRVSIVPDWYDAELMGLADLSGELAGRMVVHFTGDRGRAASYSRGVLRVSAGSRRVPGFLFGGDDGDSLWFWPESETVAFRLERAVASRLRKHLSEGVNRLVSQGALVFCHQVNGTEDGEPVIEFPEPANAAA